MKETVKKLKVPRTRRLVHLLGFCVILGLAAGGCSLPEAPGDLSWDTHLTVPLGVRTYGLADLVKPDSVIQDSGSGIGMYDSTNTTDASLYGKLFFSSYNRFDVRLVDSLIVDPFTRIVIKPANVNNYNGLADLPALQHRIRRGLIDVGQLTMTLRNIDNSASGLVTVRIPNFVSAAGDTLVIPISNVSNVARDTVVNLHNYYVDLDTAANPQQITLNIISSLAQNIQANMALSRLQFINYSGKVVHFPISGLNSATKVEKLPEGWESIHPTTVDAIVHMRRSITATADVDVNVYAYRDQLLTEQDAVASNGLYMGRDTTTVTSGLAHMLNVYPDSIRAEAAMELNGPIANCSGTDTVRLGVELRSPLSFTLDPMHAPGDQDVRKVDNSELKSIKADGSYLRIKIWNHLPVGGHVYFAIATDSLSVLSTSPSTQHQVLAFDIDTPSHDSQGNTNSVTLLEDSVSLDSITVEYLKHPPFYTRTDITLEGSNGATYIANAEDYIKVQIVAELERTVNSKGDDEE
jgi:hypothetical protein